MKRKICPRCFEEARQIHQRMVIDAALHHRIDLQGRVAGSLGGFDALQHLVDAGASAVHLAEDGIVQRVQADGQALQSRRLERVNLLWQQESVGGHG